jgi:hypothetical protein
VKPPATTAPMTKLIRTAEGFILFAFNIASIVLASVNDISPGTAVRYTAIFNTVAFASRQLLKAAAALAPGAAVDPQLIPATIPLPAPEARPESVPRPAATAEAPKLVGDVPAWADPALVMAISDAEELAHPATAEDPR